MLSIRVVGWALFAAGAWHALRTSSLDRQMQRYRVPGASPAAYFFVPLRWRRRLYTEEGQALVGEAWRTLLRMHGFTLAGMVVMAFGYAGG